jgi:hypothetical protein
MAILHPLLKDRAGSTMVEFTLVFMLLLLLTFGVVDFGNLLYQWNSAEKATQAGARTATISDPVAEKLDSFDCDNNSITLGTPCRNGGTSFGTIVCNGATSTCSGGYTFSAAALGLILAPMRKMFPRVQAQNVVVEYLDVGLGFAGRKSPVPEIRVRLTGLTFQYAFLGALLGFSNITMPDFRATLVGEDLSKAGA